jgi:hypothetical protein
MPKKPKNEDLIVEAVENTGVASVLVQGSTEPDDCTCPSCGHVIEPSPQTNKQVKLRVRVSNENRWKHMITFLLREELRIANSEFKWNLHVCQTYLLKNNRLVYTWGFVVQSSDIDKATVEICRLFDLIQSNMSLFEESGEEKVMRPKGEPTGEKASKKKSGKLVGELNEYQLVGASPDRNRPTRHYMDFRGSGKSKGAHYIGE